MTVHRTATALVLSLAAATAVVVAPPPAAAATVIAVTGRVSVSTTGGLGGAPADESFPQISTTGRFVAFNSRLPLTGGDGDGVEDVYVRDRAAGTTERVSLNDAEGEIAGRALVCGLSRDGRFVAFLATGAGTPLPLMEQIYLRDRRERTTTLVSVNTSGDPSDAGIGVSGILEDDPCPVSDDGRYVAFTSIADNLAGGDANNLGGDIFRRDVTGESTARISLSSGALGGDGISRHPAMSGDGSVIAFESDATNLVAGDSNGVRDVFVRLVATSQTQRVSVTAASAQVPLPSTEPAISQAGNHVAFRSVATTFVAGDTNGKDDVYLKNRSNGTVLRASLAPDGTQLPGNAANPDISDDGQTVSFSAYFSTTTAYDDNGDDDVYLRKVGAAGSVLISRRPDGKAGESGAWPHALSGFGDRVAFTTSSSDLVRADTNAEDDVFVRDLGLNLLPFTTVAAFVKQQFVDFEGRAPTPAEATEWAARITDGERVPDELIDELAHGATWSAKRGPLARLYWAFFLRPPDTGGMTYWTNQLAGGKKLAVVAKQFSQSSEFQTKYGALSNQAFVTKIYQNIFERNPDAGGLAYWTGRLDAKQKTRGDVMVNFSESSEGKRRLAPQTDAVLIHLGMLRVMPTKAMVLEAIDLIRVDGEPPEYLATDRREEPAYGARVDVDG